ncbi:unnamed protein product, partial [Ectocarpus sp. 8 AP-2014]
YHDTSCCCNREREREREEAVEQQEETDLLAKVPSSRWFCCLQLGAVCAPPVDIRFQKERRLDRFSSPQGSSRSGERGRRMVALLSAGGSRQTAQMCIVPEGELGSKAAGASRAYENGTGGAVGKAANGHAKG